MAVNSTEFPTIPLVNGIESEAVTDYAVISGGNLSINASREVNNIDGILSSDGITSVHSPKIVNRVS